MEVVGEHGFDTTVAVSRPPLLLNSPSSSLPSQSCLLALREEEGAAAAPLCCCYPLLIRGGGGVISKSGVNLLHRLPPETIRRPQTQLEVLLAPACCYLQLAAGLVVAALSCVQQLQPAGKRSAKAPSSSSTSWRAIC